MKKKGEIWIFARFMWNLNESRSSLFLNTRARKDMCKISVKPLTYYMYSKVVGIVRVDQQETAAWIIRLTLGLGLFCIKLIGIKFIADVVDTVPAVAECTSYTAWRWNRKFLHFTIKMIVLAHLHHLFFHLFYLSVGLKLSFWYHWSVFNICICQQMLLEDIKKAKQLRISNKD